MRMHTCAHTYMYVSKFIAFVMAVETVHIIFSFPALSAQITVAVSSGNCRTKLQVDKTARRVRRKGD